jgi:hypothetical protein
LVICHLLGISDEFNIGLNQKKEVYFRISSTIHPEPEGFGREKPEATS